MKGDYRYIYRERGTVVGCQNNMCKNVFNVAIIGKVATISLYMYLGYADIYCNAC